MKKLLLYIATVIAVFCFVLPACKKTGHPTNPTPDNYRLLSYTKITTRTIIFPPTLTPIVTENYRFVYDGYGRVAQMFFTSNDSNKMKIGMGNLSITFTYVADSIYKTHTDLNTSTVMQRDTFIHNPAGQILKAFFPNEVHLYSYYGALIANETAIYRDTNTTITANYTYTSNNGDFLNKLFDGTLTVNFPDTGIRAVVPPPYNERDTDMVLPLDITWTVIGADGSTTPVLHPGTNSYTDMITGYFEKAVTVDAVDANGVHARTGYFPAGSAARQFYQIYDQQANRMGDYLHLQSFTTYGVDIYPLAHMFKSLSSPHGTTIVSYTIDGDSKVTYVNAVIKDSLTKNVVNEAYKLQYETF